MKLTLRDRLAGARRNWIGLSFLLLLVPGALVQVQGTDRTWTGGGANAYWSTRENWNNGLPEPDDLLIFPWGSANLVNTNDFPANRRFNSISFLGDEGGYAIRGNPILVSQGVLALNLSGTNTLHLPLTQSGTNVVVYVITRGAFLSFQGDFNLNGFDLVITNAGSVQLAGAITGSGALRKYQTGALVLSGDKPNTYTGSTLIAGGTVTLDKSGAGANAAVPGPLTIGDLTGPRGSIVVRLNQSHQINDNSPIRILPSGFLDLNGFSDQVGAVTLDGANIATGAGTLSINRDVVLETNSVSPVTISGNLAFLQPITFSVPRYSTAAADLLVSASILGAGSLTKTGSGIMVLSGTNTYASPTRISQGTLLVNGLQPSNAVEVMSGAILGGNGQVGNVTCSTGAIVSPGASPGRLATGNLVFTSGAVYQVELQGAAAGTGFDYLDVNTNSTVNLGGATLKAALGFPPVEGEIFNIVRNNGAAAVSGTFNGLANGAHLTLNNLLFRVNYSGGNGNDVTLTVTNTALKTATVLTLTGNGDGLIQNNECNEVYVVLQNKHTTPVTNIIAQLTTSTPGALVTQWQSAYPDFLPAGSAYNITPFQLRTLPSFRCGRPIEFMLIVHTGNEGSFGVSFTMPTGQTGAAPVRFDNNVPVSITDLGTVLSTNNVSGLTGNIKKVTASLHATHSFTKDLEISLIAPDNTIVDLSLRNGLDGDNYGIGCSPDSIRTTFDDEGLEKITNAVAPFVGTFIPQKSLSQLIGKEGNGAWRLRLRDTAAGNTGQLLCWSLFITPAACADGGGECLGCPGTYLDSLGFFDAPQKGRLNRDNIPSGCGWPKSVPPVVDTTARHYQLHSFTNPGPATCVSVVLTTLCSAASNSLFAVAYSNVFNPADIGANYLGDSGVSVPNQYGKEVGFSFPVSAGGVFHVVVHEITPGAGCENYYLGVSGFPCPQPSLTLNRTVSTNKFLLSWPTRYPGFLLESRPAFDTNAFQVVTNWPTVNNSYYTLTNESSSPVRFYRLRKP